MKIKILIFAILTFILSSQAFAWNRITTGNVTNISVTDNGTIYGIGLDQAVYRALAGGSWERVTGGSVTNISVIEDGSIYGVGFDQAVYRQ